MIVLTVTHFRPSGFLQMAPMTYRNWHAPHPAPSLVVRRQIVGRRAQQCRSDLFAAIDGAPNQRAPAIVVHLVKGPGIGRKKNNIVTYIATHPQYRTVSFLKH